MKKQDCLDNNLLKPFVKWAGGKNQLLPNIQIKYPLGLGKNINKYCEPFVGGGAVLFDILSNYNIKEILINDINKELINTYKQIKTNVSKLIKNLSSIQNEYWNLNTKEQKQFYNEKRERFNYLKLNGNKNVNIEKATLFIFLNKTCFNGLYRVNRDGKFNVPKGLYKSPIICDEKNLEVINKLLTNVSIIYGDFELCENFIDKNTFVYVDPPYRPLNNTASFTAYDKMNFDDNEQKRLCRFIDKIVNKGAKIVLSNSDPKNIDSNDNFFDDLYSKYSITRIDAKRVINSKGNNRGLIKELLIAN